MHRRPTYVNSGSVPLDSLLKGGFKRGELSLIYGKAGTGKSNLTLQLSAQTVMSGGKVIYIDADQSFIYERFIRIVSNLEEQSPNIIIFLPEFFHNQTKIIESLEKYIVKATHLVIVDTITTLYRVSSTSPEEWYILNRELNRQLAYLSSLAHTRDVAVVITSQVHARLNTPIPYIEPVAKRTLLHWPQTIIRLESTDRNNVKRAIVERRHSQDISNASCHMMLTDRGFE